jgi:hypothetical protein
MAAQLAELSCFRGGFQIVPRTEQFWTDNPSPPCNRHCRDVAYGTYNCLAESRNNKSNKTMHQVRKGRRQRHSSRATTYHPRTTMDRYVVAGNTLQRPCRDSLRPKPTEQSVAIARKWHSRAECELSRPVIHPRISQLRVPETVTE